MRKKGRIAGRLYFFGLVINFFFCFLIFRLFMIQIIDGEYYAKKAAEQRILTISTGDLRGDILDRNGIPLTRVAEEAYLYLFPALLYNNERALLVVRNLTGLDMDELEKRMDAAVPFVKIRVLHSIPEAELDIERGKYPGLILVRKYARYGDESVARHVVGYLRGDGVPMTGIEKAYSGYLDRGTSEMIYAVTDARGRIIPGIGYKIARTGKTYYHVQLTLDYHIQKIMEDILDGHPGRNSGLVVDASTGEILALASRPHFDQNDIENSMKDEDSLWAAPLRQFPPGSVFKVIVAAAALEAGMFTEDSHFYCSGGITIGGIHYSCHFSGGLGDITFREAFAYSCNDTFIEVASKIGGSRIVEMAKRFGFGEALDIPLVNDAGSLPAKGEYAGPGIGNLAIGQGKVMVTPLQVADMMVTIVNDGKRKKLKLVKALVSDMGKVMPLENEAGSVSIISPYVARKLREWMADVTEYGTGKLAQDPEIGGTAGKTGTPEVSGDPKASHYGWFAGFFPRENPRYIIVILSREEGGGGKTAAPIFREVAHGIWEYENELVCVTQD